MWGLVSSLDACARVVGCVVSMGGSLGWLGCLCPGCGLFSFVFLGCLCSGCGRGFGLSFAWGVGLVWFSLWLGCMLACMWVWLVVSGLL